MLNCLLIDDEPLALSLLADYVSKIDQLHLAGSFTNAIEALHFLEGHSVDIIFLDIQMPDLNGIQFGKIIKGRVPIILTTAYDQYAMDGYELDVIDYLLKPISFERFLIAIQKLKQRLNTSKPKNQVQNAPKPSEQRDYIFVKTSYKTQKTNLGDILYFEGLSDYVRIHTSQEKILTLEKMKDFTASLPPDRFIRVHRSYIVAIDKIDYIERNRIIIQDQRIPIGATYQKAFWQKIGGK